VGIATYPKQEEVAPISMLADYGEYEIAFGRCERRNPTRDVRGYEKSAVLVFNSPQPCHHPAL
jgi:hypothetical protein